MIAIVCKNLASLISKHNSFVCKSHVPFSFPLHSLSTLTETQLVTSPTVYDVLVHKHHISPQVASLVASALSRCKFSEKADSILVFLEESGFSSAQLEKIVKYKPRILTARFEDDIKFKIKIFRDLGLSSKDIAMIISRHRKILIYNAKNSIIPSLSLLKGLVGSDYDVARLLRKSSWFLSTNLEKSLIPNVEYLKSCGIPMERILFSVYTFPRFLLIKPDTVRKSAEKIKEMGLNQSSKVFIYALRIVASMNEKTWELRLQGFRNLGFSDSDILSMFRKSPPFVSGSMEKIKKVKELLLGTGKFDMSSIMNNPSSLGSSIEKRLKPRLRVLGILESKNLIRKWPGLGTLYTLPDDKFFERFVSPYLNEVGEEYFPKSCVKGKKEPKL